MIATRLRIYRAESGQWSGIVLDANGEEITRIDDCESPGEVEDVARDTWPDIEPGLTEEAKAFWASFADKPNTDVDRVTLDVPPEFTAFCTARGLTSAQVLAAFMLDLAELPGSNGSDERMRAAAWFDRVIWPDAGEDTALSRQ